MRRQMQRMNSLSCYKQILQLSVPILFAHLVEALMPFINTKLAASLGQISLAAAGLVGSTFIAVMGFCWGIVSAVGIIAAHKIGANEEASRVGAVLWSCFLLVLVMSFPVMLCFKWMGPLWSLLGQNPQVVQEAKAYMTGILWAVPSDLAKFAIFQFAIACGRPRLLLVTNVVSLPILTLINYLLIQKLGIYGLGLGTSIGYGCVFLGVFIFLLLSSFFKPYLFFPFHHLKRVAHLCFQLLKLGVPIGLMFSIELLFFMAMALMIGYLGTAQLAANQIAVQWMWMTVMIAFGFTEGVTILVAKAYGEKNYSLIMQTTLLGSYLALAVTLLVALGYWLVPEWIIRVDLEKTEQTQAVFRFATTLLAYCGVYQLFDSTRIVVAGSLRGIGDSQYPMWLSIVEFWLIALPIGYVCAFTLNFGAPGFWIGLIMGVVLGALLQWRRLNRFCRRSMKWV